MDEPDWAGLDTAGQLLLLFHSPQWVTGPNMIYPGYLVEWQHLEQFTPKRRPRMT